MSKETFIEIHLCMTNNQNRQSEGTELLDNLLASIPDNSTRNIAQEMVLNIKKGRPNWTNVF